MLIKRPSIESITLESAQASSDGFHYVSAVRALSFRVSTPSSKLKACELNLLKEGADRNLHSLIGKEQPPFLGLLNSDQGKYEDLCLLNVRQSGDRTFLTLRSLTFSAIGNEEEVRRQIVDSLDMNTLYLQVNYVN
jgi:hypothetical protein